MGHQHVNDYFRLFVRREGKVVLGRHCSNLWIMSVVLFVAFIALAFSNASTKYLLHKMDDPFIKWQNIENNHNGQAFNDLVADLSNENVQARFHFSNVKEDYKHKHFNVYGKDLTGIFPSYCRLYTDMDTELMRTILDSSNVVNRPVYNLSGLKDAISGVVITEQMLKILGYDDYIPPYLYLSVATDNASGEVGSLMSYDDGQATYIKVPIPVLGVVRRLPGNVPYSGSLTLFGKEEAFYLGSEKKIDVSNSLLYFVDERVDENVFKDKLLNLCAEAGFPSLEIYSPYHPELMSFAKGKLLEVDQACTMGWEAVKAINEAVIAEFPENQVVRLFDFELDREPLTMPLHADYLTVEFKDLDKLPQFIDYVSEITEGAIEVDITQTSVKENLNTIQTLANILSIALILFAIANIVLFIVNLLQSYFQRVKKNLGTFKAFGISNRELVKVYLVIILASVASAIVIALAAVFIIQCVLPAREPGFQYLSLWCPLTFISIAIVFVASVLTVYFVMRGLLKATPGDLIYDRQ